MADTQQDELAPERRPFAAFLQEARNGGLHDECSQALNDLVSACEDTGKKGTLVLTVEIRPMKKAQQTMVVTSRVATKAPKHDAPEAIFFVDANGNLVRDDPRQMNIGDIREVPAPAAVAPRELDKPHVREV